MSTVEKNEVREENVSRETIDDKPVEVELPLGLDEKDKKSGQVTEVKEEKKEEDEVTEYSKKVQTRINQITDRYRKEQRDKEEAVRLAKQLKDQNSKLETQIQNLDKGYISEYGTRIESQLATASEAYKKALEVNDTDAMVKASQAIAKVTIELLNKDKRIEMFHVKQFKLNLKSRHKHNLDQSQIQKLKRGQKRMFGLVKTMK